MPRTFVRKVTALAALIGSVFIVVWAAFAFSFISTFKADDEALSMYAEDLILAQSLEEALQRKLADGRGYLLAHDGQSRRAFDQADADIKGLTNELRARVKSEKGIVLFEAAARGIAAHDLALRRAMEARGSVDAVARLWVSDVQPHAAQARRDMEAFSEYKRSLYDRAKAHAFRAQRRALWVTTSIVVVAVLAGALGGVRLLRSARSTFAVEVRARAAAEQERGFFTAMLNNLPIGVIAAEAPSGRILLVTEWANRLLRNEIPEGARPEFASLLFHEVDGSLRANEGTPLARALAGQVAHGEETQTAGGRVFAMTAAPIRNAEGAVIAAVVGFTDMTKKKEAEKERELFIGALGHDLRNPLAAISLAADTLARQRDLPAAAARPVARIASCASRMNELILELLDFASSQHGALPIKPELCKMSDVASEIIAEVKIAHPDRDIRLHSDDDCIGYWDRGRLSQVFQNLVGNAVLHGDPLQPIEVKIGRLAGRVWAKVVNRGATVPHEEQARIFDPFRKSQRSTGLGLGLYIARAIIEAHDGSISLESTSGQTTFAIDLPSNAIESPTVAEGDGPNRRAV
jgi:signal transduction histidine kinase